MIEKQVKSKAVNFLQQYSKSDLLRTIAAISILPSNYGKTVRLEQLTAAVFKESAHVDNSVSSKALADYLKANYQYDIDEDAPINLFTEPVIFFGGDFLTFPGITTESTFILSGLLTAIFSWTGTNFPPQFMSNCRQGCELLLNISNSIAKRLQFSRYQYPEVTDNLIEVPNQAVLDKFKQAVVFSDSDMRRLMESFKINVQAVNNFCFAPGKSKLQEIQEQLSLKPLCKSGSDFIVHSPASITYALIEFIWEQAAIFNQSDALEKAYHSFNWNETKLHLQLMRFQEVDIKHAVFPNFPGIETLVSKIDSDKLALVQYVQNSRFQPSISPKELAADKERFIIELLVEYPDHQFLDINVLSLANPEIQYKTVGNKYSQTISMTEADIETLADSKEAKALDLWKFATALDQQIPRAFKFGMLSMMDQFKVYKDNGDSFYMSNEGRMDIGQWGNGVAQEYVHKVKSGKDEHAAFTIHPTGKLVKEPVERKDKYGPIYLSPMSLASSDLKFFIEGLPVGVWIRPIITKKTEGLNHTHWELTDAISYWLWQLTNSISPVLRSVQLPVLILQYQLDQEDKFDIISDNFTRDPGVFQKLKVSAAKETVTMLIPPEIIPYLYGSDNEGDRILVRHILLAINAFLINQGEKFLSDQEIEAIINKDAPVGFKKKFFILNSVNNLLIDPRCMGKSRLAQDYDESVVQNSILNWLGKASPPVGEITGQNKKSLTISIVMKALLPKLTACLLTYDKTFLLERLIGLNETLIQKREMNRIFTPARIACFVSESQQIEDLMDRNSEINRTAIAVRCLIEHIGAEPEKGAVKISTTQLDELIALMSQIVNWGSLGDQLNHDLFDINLAVVPAGRVRVDKRFQKDVFDPYHRSKTAEAVTDAYKQFEQEFTSREKPSGSGVPPKIDAAFVIEFGISFTALCDLMEVFVYEAFEVQKKPFTMLPKKDLITTIKKFKPKFSDDEIQHAIDFLSTVNRGTVLTVPEGCENYDISPWRFNRRLSLYRKPLIVCENSADPENSFIYWGPRQIIMSRLTIAEQLEYGRFKAIEKGEVASAMGSLAAKRGANLVKAAIEKLKITGLIIDTDVFISPHGTFKHPTDIGDVDILIIDAVNKVLYSLECKSFAPSRNIKEMTEECDRMMGTDSEKGYLRRHVDRHNWLKSNMTEVGKHYGVDLTEFEIKSFMVTREDMLFPYLKNKKTELPFITLYDIERDGLQALN